MTYLLQGWPTALSRVEPTRSCVREQSTSRLDPLKSLSLFESPFLIERIAEFITTWVVEAG